MMMRLVAGIDYRGGYRDSISAIKALGYEQARITLVHGWGSKQSPKQVIPTANVLGSVLEQEAGNLIRNALADCSAIAKDIDSRISSEQAIIALYTIGQEVNADLIVVRPTVRSNSNRPYGATTHALIEMLPNNLLIAKNTPTNMVIEQALFVTDGSSAGTEALKEFQRICPPNIKKITVLSVAKVLVSAKGAAVEPTGVAFESFGGIEYSDDIRILDEAIEATPTTLLVTFDAFKSDQLILNDVLATSQPSLLIKTY
jgi:hypothetical protein